MSREALVILELSRRHMCAMKEEDETTRARLFQMLDDFEWAFPNAKAEVEAMYPQKSKEGSQDAD